MAIKNSFLFQDTKTIIKPIELEFKIIKDKENKGAYGPVFRSWSVYFDQPLRGSNDFVSKGIQALAKESAKKYIAEVYNVEIERLEAGMIGFNLREIGVCVPNLAWDGPDPDDDFLMKV